jgi:hypothetical protein
VEVLEATIEEEAQDQAADHLVEVLEATQDKEHIEIKQNPRKIRGFILYIVS